MEGGVDIEAFKIMSHESSAATAPSCDTVVPDSPELHRAITRDGVVREMRRVRDSYSCLQKR
jgi:hypothetical protein